MLLPSDNGGKYRQRRDYPATIAISRAPIRLAVELARLCMSPPLFDGADIRQPKFAPRDSFVPAFAASGSLELTRP